MAEADLPDGLRLSEAAGWNQTEEDWRLLLSLGPGRFRVATDGGRVVGTGGTVAYGSQLGWICMILVDPSRQGRGVGTRLFEDVLAHAAGLDVVGLDATPGGRPLYERAGFAGAYPLARLQREPTSPGPEPGSEASAAPAMGTEHLRPLGAADLEPVLAWDREAFGADRGPVLEWALKRAPEYAWGAYGRSGLDGYLLGRHGRRFEHLGPVVARGIETAEALVAGCLVRFPDRRFGLDALTDQPGWRATLERLGFRERRPFTRMYRAGEDDPGRRDAVFAALGPEFG
jgi:GNAT superfamily N-acetyltransferase